MKIEILLFGITKDIMGGNTHTIELPEEITVAGLKNRLLEDFPALEKLRSLLVAVNSEYGQDDQPLQGTDEIAIIPPVSGG